MNNFRYTVFLCISFLLPFIGYSQSTLKDIEKDLKSLSGSHYIKQAIDGAIQLAKEKEYEDAKKLLNKAVKKAKSKSNNTEAVVLITKANVMAAQFPLEKKYIEEIAETVERSLKRNNATNIMSDALKIYKQINGVAENKLKIKDRIIVLEESLRAIDNESKIIQGEQIANELLIETKAEAAIEIQALRKERVRLENVTEQLAESVELNERQLSRRKAIILKMSKEKSDNEAIIQYNKRIIDSLEFSAKLDSINILNGQHLIAQQESALELAQSEIRIKDAELELKNSNQKLYFTLLILGLLTLGFLAFIIIESRKANRKLQKSRKLIEIEKERAEDLLLNILPEFIALELKEKHKVKTRYIDHCTVMFTDFINFSNISKKLPPKELIETLDECFKAFDKISSDFNIEKIKTIGDSYMCASGVPVPSKTHALDAIYAAQKMIEFLEEWNAERERQGKIRFDARIGIHSGPVIAGVVGLKKFAYDIWGDTVNIAARIEGQSSAQRINISSSTYKLTKDHFKYESRGKIAVKNMKELSMYYLNNGTEAKVKHIKSAS